MTIDELNIRMQELLAKPRSASQTYRAYLANIFKTYKRLFAESRGELISTGYYKNAFDQLQAEVDASCQDLLDIYDLYMQGRIGDAIRQMRISYTKDLSVFTSEISLTDVMYRARVLDTAHSSYDVKEMFHVPFEKRGKIANNRYSIAGFPCLYLGKSILAYWEEMGKPNPDNLCVSRVAVREKQTCNVINLCWSDKIKYPYDVDIFRINLQVPHILERTPLIAACSVRVQDTQQPFKEEYVLPQVLLLSCVGNEDVDGIAYTSTRRDAQISSELELHTNYVIPAQKITDTGYCRKLTQKFRITNGISFMEAEIKNVFHAKGMQIIDIKGSSLCIDDVDLKKSDYQCTKFGQMEEYLGKQPYNILHRESRNWEIVPDKMK